MRCDLDNEIHDKLRLLTNVEPIVFSTIELDQTDTKTGGFAIVHRGKWLGNQVAVKWQARHVDDIVREVDILQKVKGHPNMVQFLNISA
jgi:hypothetical protein